MILKDFNLFFPESLQEAEGLLKKLKEAVVLGGGTFFLPLFKKAGRVPQNVISLKNISDLNRVKIRGDVVCIGAMATLDDCTRNPLLKKDFSLFCESIQKIATPQIRNRATVGGNICSCLPWADLPCIFLALDATLDFGGQNVAMRDFLRAPKEALKKKILREIIISSKAIEKFILIRLPRLNATDIPLCAVCIVETSEAVTVTANIGNSYPRRFKRIEMYLKERFSARELMEAINQELDFQKDAYRRQMLAVCLRRAVEQYGRT